MSELEENAVTINVKRMDSVTEFRPFLFTILKILVLGDQNEDKIR